MFGFEIFGALEIRDRAGDLEKPNNSLRGREPKLPNHASLSAYLRDIGNTSSSVQVYCFDFQCVSLDINHDIAGKLRTFYKQKHADSLQDQHAQQQLAFCFFQRTAGNTGIGVGITTSDFENTSTFHELLDSCFRPLRVSVRALFRRVAIELGTVALDTDPVDFQDLLTSNVYRDEAAITALCDRLRAVMATFPSGEAETEFKKLLAKENTEVSSTITSLL